MADAPTGQPSPFEIVTSSKTKKGNKGLVVGILIVVFLILSVVAGVLLVRQNQEVREKAAANECPAAEACPYGQDPTLLRNCTPPEADNSPSESVCSTAGRIESCGGVQYCCPSPGAAWTPNLSLCPTATATATATASPEATIEALVEQATAEPTESPTPTGTAVATLAPVGTSTPLAIPVTGTSWPTILGAGVGILVIIASILIAL